MLLLVALDLYTLNPHQLYIISSAIKQIQETTFSYARNYYDINDITIIMVI